MVAGRDGGFDMNTYDTTSAANARVRQSEMSYKFQRLREKLRQAIDTGELAGKLPGERALAKRFHVNAKTLSKALTDLAAEGLLDRSIGRGTYVKGSAPSQTSAGRWLLLCDSREEDRLLVDALQAVNVDLQTAHSAVDMRPSFLNQFSAVIDLASSTPESFLRDLVVRSMPVVAVNRELHVYSMNAVMIDAVLAVSRLGRDLMLAGHRRLAAVEPRGTNTIAQTLRKASDRYAAGAVVESFTADEISTLIDHGFTGVVCDSAACAARINAHLDRSGHRVPEHFSLTAVGIDNGSAPCSGYFCSSRQIADSVVELLKAPTARPTTLWLAAEFQDRGTIKPIGATIPVQELANVRVGGIAV